MGLFTKKREPKEEDVESTVDEQTTPYAEPSTKFTCGHFKYLLFRDAIPSMLFMAVVNMSLSYVMYVLANKGPSVYLLRLPNSLAGDAAVTIIFHCTSTWYLKFHLVHRHLRKHIVQPMAFFDIQPLTEDICWLMFLPVEREAPVEPVRMDSWKWAFRHAQRIVVLITLLFLSVWPISLIPLIMVGDREAGDFVYYRQWTPQIYKTILGTVLGSLIAPVLSVLWLVRAAWEVEDGEARSARTQQDEF